MFTTVTYDDNLNNISMSSETVINQIAENEHLQTQQLIVFRIIARSFINTYVEKKKEHEESLRMFLTGPGGTGKAHVVKAVQKVMVQNTPLNF
jgi:pantothenate kinase-related protein Tda10